MKQEYIDLVENTWGEDEEFAEALFFMLGEDEKLFERVVKEDLSFNRYTCDVSTWGDLLETIIQDPCFEDKEYNDYIDDLINIRDNCVEEEIKAYLIQQNWAIDTVNDIAIGFDDSVNVVYHEV